MIWLTPSPTSRVKSHHFPVVRDCRMHVLFRRRRRRDGPADAIVDIDQMQSARHSCDACGDNGFRRIPRPRKKSVRRTSQGVQFDDFSLRAAQGGHDPDGASERIRSPAECDPLAIRRPGRAVVDIFVRSQAQRGRRGVHQLQINVEIVLGVAVPGEGDLSPVGRECRSELVAQGYDRRSHQQ